MSDHTLKDGKSLEEQLAQAQEELAILYDISNAMRMTLELDHVLYIILTGVTAHTGLGFNRAVLFLPNKKERIFESRMVIGPESPEDAARIWKHIETENKDLEDLVSDYNRAKGASSSLATEIKELKIPLNANEGGLLASVYVNGAPLHVKKDLIAQYADDPLLKVFKTSELVIMPLKAKDKVNGIIVADNLYTQKPITTDDLRIFTMLANQAGLAIENSQLYEMVVHKSHTDSLTNLWNHGFFQDTLLKEIEKAKEKHTPLGLVVFDIDDFKKINDSFGHQQGDMILTELAKILKEASREANYVCRFGGEEFSMILPETSKEQSFIIAERLRVKIEEHRFPIAPSKEPVRLTVSIGVAAFPADAPSKEELIAKADKAMYTAKFIGKNKTCSGE